jgi:N-acyl homoserine lactone hydrolase
MKRFAAALALSLCVAAGAQAAAPAPAAPVKMWRLDCGQIQSNNLNDFSDTFAYTGQTKLLDASCYLIKHADTYMLWDTGLPKELLGLPLTGPGAPGATLAKLLTTQLATIGVKPEQISIIGVSHHHFDHIGQAADFPGARLLIGAPDVAELKAPGNAGAKALAHWLSGDGKLEPVTGDKDVFGDGSVVMLNLPGHTPGHHGLLVRLAKTGPVVLSGDLAHLTENYVNDGVPAFNIDRAQSLASISRVKQIVANLHGMLIIQHEARDVAKLPAFPAAAD